MTWLWPLHGRLQAPRYLDPLVSIRSDSCVSGHLTGPDGICYPKLAKGAKGTKGKKRTKATVSKKGNKKGSDTSSDSFVVDDDSTSDSPGSLDTPPAQQEAAPKLARVVAPARVARPTPVALIRTRTSRLSP